MSDDRDNKERNSMLREKMSLFGRDGEIIMQDNGCKNKIEDFFFTLFGKRGKLYGKKVVKL